MQFFSKVQSWVDERMHLNLVLDFLHQKKVPQHKHSFWYLFGGLSLFFFVIQLGTGMLLLMYYSPTPETAHESMTQIMTEVPFGWLIRSMHKWSANLMIASVFVHLFSTMLLRSYRKPRELMWMSGVVQFFLVLGFAFTGSLLPWDTLGYFATQIGTEIPKTIPLVGEIVVKTLRGSDFVDGESLKRMFALHVAILPLATLLVVIFHLVLNQVHGSSTPIGVQPKEKGIPFYPNYIYRDVLSWIAGFFLLFSLVIFFPAELGTKANPFASAPVGIKPEWYFLPLFQTLKFVPSTIFGMNSEVIVNSFVGILSLAVMFLPFIDRKAERNESSKVITFCGVVGILYMVITIILAYTTS
ncbi:MAG: cytochrome bc complex cytochrome b subunit [Ignavibacteriae bacterium]|nr:cytochrome bc complex cytochrome b subunit [Ignavibacteriota bacterium]